MSDDLDATHGFKVDVSWNYIRKDIHASALAAKDAEIARLREALADAFELTEAGWRGEALAKMQAALGPAAKSGDE